MKQYINKPSVLGRRKGEKTMKNENKNVEKYALQMTSTALQEFFNDGNVRLSIDFSDDGKIKKVIAEKRQGNMKLNFNTQCNTGISSNTESNTKDQNITELDIKKAVTNLIHEIAVPAHLSGYEYVRTAIMLTIEDPEMLKCITKKLYPTIAKQYSKTPARVERAIRHAIEVACTRGNTKFLDSIFGYTISPDKGKPTNSQFIALIADYVKMELNM